MGTPVWYNRRPQGPLRFLNMETRYEVEVRDVTKRFGKKTAVDSVSVSVARGEFLTLLGPSGCGKTTLLRMIAGFEVPDSGHVILGGRDVTHLPPHQRDVTTVFQHYALFPHLDVFANVSFGLRRRHVGADKITQRVASALELVSLSGVQERQPSGAA